MSQIIPFEQSKLPAHISSLFQVTNDLSNGVGGSGGFPHVSIKGKVFHIIRGDEKTLVTKGDEDAPASSIEVVIVKANAGLSKVYYSSGYVEGSDAKPTCFSNDGVTPDGNAQEPQASKCATCAHNQWGSRVSESGAQGKACSDSRRIAIAAPTQVNDPMLLRVPAASLKTLAQYNDLLTKRGVPYQAVVTKIGFDYSVAHPALSFKPVGFIDDATAAEVREVMDSEVVNNILGTVNAAPSAPAPALAKPAPVVEAPKPKSAPKVAASDSLANALGKAKPTAKVAVEEEPEAKPVPKAKPAAVVEVDSMDDLMDGLDGLLTDD